MSKAQKNTAPGAKENASGDFAFEKQNYLLMIAGIVVIIIGYMLMAGGGSDDPNKFNPEVLSPRRITLAPIVVLLGLAIEIYAILKKPKS